MVAVYTRLCCIIYRTFIKANFRVHILVLYNITFDKTPQYEHILYSHLKL